MENQERNSLEAEAALSPFSNFPPTASIKVSLVNGTNIANIPITQMPLYSLETKTDADSPTSNDDDEIDDSQPIINYDYNTNGYTVTYKKKQKQRQRHISFDLKQCFLNCKNNLPIANIIQIRTMFENLSQSEKKEFIKNCMSLKSNLKIKRKKKYKRDRTYNCKYYLVLNNKSLRVCQRCFRCILGLSHYNLSNIIKESLCHV